MIYAVIKVENFYDFVEGVECVKSFNFKAEADEFVEGIRTEHLESIRKKQRYDDEWVSKIKVPEDPSYSEWRDWVTKFKPYGYSSFTTPENFKNGLKQYLFTHNPSDLEGYNPPATTSICDNLFVIEIKDP